MSTRLQVLLRLGCRPIPALALTGLVAVRIAAGLSDDMRLLQAASYVVALLSVVLALALCITAERVTWSRGSAQPDVLFAVAVLILLLLEQASSAGLLLLGHVPASSLNPLVTLHLAAGALVARRLPGSATTRCLAFVLGMTVVPALLPFLRPLLDPSSALRESLFSRPTASLASILTLVVLAFALPPRSARAESTSR